MKDIKKKNKYMLNVENRFKLPLEVLLHKLYIMESKTHVEVAKELGITFSTVMDWLYKAGIYSNRLQIKQPKYTKYKF